MFEACTVWRLFGVALIAVTLARASAAPLDARAPPPSANEASGPPTAVLLELTGAIGPATTLYLRSGLAEAARRNAQLVILRMNTPGGLDAAMRDIISEILASRIPVVTYVSPSGARAASAGTYILYASHLAAMAPGTHLGAATPVQLGGDGGQPRDRSKEPSAPPDPARAKAVNDAAAYIRGLADLHGRNAQWAERAVREAATLPAREALEQNVIEIVAPDLDGVLAAAHGRTVRFPDGSTRQLSAMSLAIVHVEPDWRVQLLAVITNPNVAYILLLVGIYGILFEFMSPGTVFSGVIGAICLLIALFALNLLPINYAGIGLMLLGIALVVAEVFSPSFGILGIGGIVALALGSLFLFDTDIPGFTLSLPVILTATLASAAFVLIGGGAAIRSHSPARRDRGRRAPRQPGKRSGMVGRRGTSARPRRTVACARSGAPLGPATRSRHGPQRVEPARRSRARDTLNARIGRAQCRLTSI